jgi:hypothetical protein
VSANSQARAAARASPQVCGPVPPCVSGALAARERPAARSSCSSTSKEDT